MMQLDDETQRFIEASANRLSEASMKLEDHGPDALRAWIGETMSDAEVRDLLLVALIAYTQAKIEKWEAEDRTSQSPGDAPLRDGGE